MGIVKRERGVSSGRERIRRQVVDLKDGGDVGLGEDPPQDTNEDAACAARFS